MNTKVTYDELLAKEPNKYKLAMTLGKRYGQIVGGENPLVKVNKKDTVAEIVSKELLEDKIKLVEQVIED